jgi:RNA polymerase sigma factor (sigma-70 family)
MSSAGSVTQLLGLIKTGDAEAAQKLWELFSRRLLNVARTRLPAHSLGVADEEDVVQSVLASFFTGARRGKFTRLRNRSNLWILLSLMTKRKALNLCRDQSKRRPPVARPAHDPSTNDRFVTCVEELIDPALSPQVQVLVQEECQRMLNMLDDARLRSIAIWKMEGYTDAEIASMLGCAARTIERKLALIRGIWSQEESS